MTLAFIEGFGSPLHWLIVAFVCLLIFGRRLPEVGRSLGKGITEFKKGLKDAGDEVGGHAQDPYQQTNSQPMPPQRQPQQFQGGYQQPPMQQQQYQGGYQQPQQQQQMQQPRMPQQPAVAGQSQVRVTRNDMVD